MDYILSITTKRKNVGAYLPLFRYLGCRMPLPKEQQSKSHAGEYSTPVKCASEDMVSPRSTLRRVYTTPRDDTSAFAFDW